MSINETLQQPGRGRWPYVAWVCALSPLILLLIFIALGIHIRLGLGPWPTPMTEDYHAPAFKFHEAILQVHLLFTLFGAGPLWLLCLLVRPLRPAWPRTVVSQLITYALGWLLIFAILTFDPTTLSAWFLD